MNYRVPHSPLSSSFLDPPPVFFPQVEMTVGRIFVLVLLWGKSNRRDCIGWDCLQRNDVAFNRWQTCLLRSWMSCGWPSGGILRFMWTAFTMEQGRPLCR